MSDPIDETLKKEDPFLPVRLPFWQQKKRLGVLFLALVFMVVILFLPGIMLKKPAKAIEIMERTHRLMAEDLPRPTLPPMQATSAPTPTQAPPIEQRENVVSLLEGKQTDASMLLERAQLLARVKSAALEAKLQETMNCSSALSGLGAGDYEPKTIDNPDTSGDENPNTVFLKRVGSATTKEEEAGLLGDLRLRITEGKIIKGVMDGSLDSDLPSTLRAHVTEDVYGDQGDIILIPNGARLIGEYRSGRMKNGQTRVFVVWKRLIEPNGISVNLASAGADALGRAGMTGEVDKHGVERFGSAVLMSMISAGSAIYGVNTQDQYNSIAQFRGGVAQSFSAMANQELKESANIQNTIRIPQGEPLVIVVNHDLSFEGVLQEMGALG